MLKISYFHTNTHTETFVPLITCIIDDIDLEKCSSRSTRFMTLMKWYSSWLMSGTVLSSVINVWKYENAQNLILLHIDESMKFWAFNLTLYNAHFILPIIFVNFMNIVARYTTCILLQISWRIREWEKFENWSTFVKLMNECIVAQFYWDMVYKMFYEVDVCLCEGPNQTSYF